MEIMCSNCGARQRFGIKYANVKSLIALGWNSVGSALYCPECVRTWATETAIIGGLQVKKTRKIRLCAALCKRCMELKSNKRNKAVYLLFARL